MLSLGIEHREDLAGRHPRSSSVRLRVFSAALRGTLPTNSISRGTLKRARLALT
jgi:hypothetical protein